MTPPSHGLDRLQRTAMSLMAILVLLTFFGTNIQAILWQSSEWLVSTVLPATVVDLTNDERADNTAAPLQRNSTLDEAATQKAQHMAENEYFSHYAPDGTSPWHWFDESGYVYAHAGENLAIHFTDSSQVVDAWMNSPTHRANIVDPKYTEIGVGTAKGEFEGYDTVYVVQLFGAPGATPPASPVVSEPESEPVPESVSPTPTADVPAPEAESAPDAADAPASEFAASEEQAPALLGEDVDAIEPETGAPEAAEAIETADTATTSVPVAAEPSTPQPIAPTDTIEPEPPIERSGESVDMVADDVVVLETSLIATSSGLAVAQMTTPNDGHAGATLASIATRPHMLLQVVYITLAAVVVFLLSTSVVLEARRFHYRQVAYGVLLLFSMGGLWFVHSLLTTGAVIA